MVAGNVITVMVPVRKSVEICFLGVMAPGVCRGRVRCAQNVTVLVDVFVAIVMEVANARNAMAIVLSLAMTAAEPDGAKSAAAMVLLPAAIATAAACARHAADTGASPATVARVRVSTSSISPTMPRELQKQ